MPRLSLTHTTYHLKKQLLPKRTIKTIDLVISSVDRLTENEIIHVNNLFTTYGFHTILLKDQKESRALINRFLPTLNYYKSIACLTNPASIVPTHVDNLAYMFEQENDLDAILTECFYYDFVWIEEYQLVADQAKLLKIKLKELNLHAELPIISFLYR